MLDLQMRLSQLEELRASAPLTIDTSAPATASSKAFKVGGKPAAAAGKGKDVVAAAGKKPDANNQATPVAKQAAAPPPGGPGGASARATATDSARVSALESLVSELGERVQQAADEAESGASRLTLLEDDLRHDLGELTEAHARTAEQLAGLLDAGPRQAQGSPRAAGGKKARAAPKKRPDADADAGAGQGQGRERGASVSARNEGEEGEQGAAGGDGLALQFSYLKSQHEKLADKVAAMAAGGSGAGSAASPRPGDKATSLKPPMMAFGAVTRDEFETLKSVVEDRR